MTYRIALLGLPALLAACVTGDPTLPGRATTREAGTTQATQILDANGAPALLVECTRSQANCVERSAQVCGGPARVVPAGSTPGGTTFVRSGFAGTGFGHRRGFRGGLGFSITPIVIPSQFTVLAYCPEGSGPTFVPAEQDNADLQSTSQ